MLLDRIIKTEPFFIVVFVLIALRESFVFDSVSTTAFNAAIVLALLPIYFNAKINNDFYLVLSFSLLLMISMCINIAELHLGGFNAFVLLLTLLPFVFLKPKAIDFKKLGGYWVLVSAVFLFVVYYYYLSGSQVILERISYILGGPYVNQNTLSMFLLSLIALLLNFYNRHSASLIKNKFFHLVIFILYFSIFLTQARAAMLSATILLLFYYRRKILFVAPLLLSTGFVFLLFNPDINERLFFKLTNASSSGRIDFWVEVINSMIADIEIFLFGYGVNNTLVEYEGNTLSVHSSYVDFLANYGFIAFSFLIFLITYMLYKAYQSSGLIFVTVFSLLFYGLLETVLFSGYSVVWVTLLFIYYSRTESKKNYAYFNHPVRALGY